MSQLGKFQSEYGISPSMRALGLEPERAGQVGGAVLGYQGEPAPLIPAPALKTPPAMPTPNDEAVRVARRKALAGVYKRRGRESTILSDAVTGAETLG